MPSERYKRKIAGGLNAITKRKWDIGQALKMRISKCMTYAQIAKVMDVDEQSIKRGLSPLLSLMGQTDLLAGFRENEASFMDSIRMLALQAMSEQLNDPVRRKKMDMMRLNVVYGTLFDKQRLSRGESTVNIHQLTSIITAAHKPKEMSTTQPTG